MVLCISKFIAVSFYPSLAHSEGGTAHRVIYTKGISEVLRQYPQIYWRFHNYFVSNSIPFERDSSVLAAENRNNYPSDILFILRPLNPDPCNVDEECPSLGERLPECCEDREVPDWIEMIANESVMTDWYADVQIYIPSGSIAEIIFVDLLWGIYDPEYGFSFGGENMNFTAFNHFMGIYDEYTLTSDNNYILSMDKIGYSCYKVRNTSLPFGMLEWDFLSGNIYGIYSYDGPLDLVFCNAFEHYDVELDIFSQSLYDYLRVDPNAINLHAHVYEYDLGGEEVNDDTFMPVWRMGTYWLFNYLYRTPGDRIIRFIGPAAHAITDAQEPHHVYGVNGNFHSSWEAFISYLWNTKETDEERERYKEMFGNSMRCRSYVETEPSYYGDINKARAKCIVDWALEYLQRANARVLAGDYGETGYEDLPNGDVISFYKALMDEASVDGMRTYELMDDINIGVEQYIQARIPGCMQEPVTIYGCSSCRYYNIPEPPYRLVRINKGIYCVHWTVNCPCNPDRSGNCDCKDGILSPLPELSTIFNAGSSLKNYPEVINNQILEGAWEEVDRGVATALAFLALVASEGDPLRDTGEIDHGFEADGIPDILDTCPYYPNSEQTLVDSDGDSLGDDCDLCPHQSPSSIGLDPVRDVPWERINDFDRDGVGNLCDNCPGWYNPVDATGFQPDRDNDGRGDICDNCIDIPNIDQRDCHLEQIPVFWWGLYWPRRLPEVDHYSGDACDTRLCSRKWTMSINQTGCDGECNMTNYSSWLEVNLVHTGYPEEHIDWLTAKWTDNAFCDCEGASYSECTNPLYPYQCQNSTNISHGPAENGWQRMLRITDYIPEHDTRFLMVKRYGRLYSGQGIDPCPPQDDVRRQNRYGCNRGDDERWYNHDSIGRSITGGWPILWRWTSEEKLGCEPDSMCSANVRLYFNPLEDETGALETAMFYPPIGLHHLETPCEHIDVYNRDHTRIVWSGCYDDYIEGDYADPHNIPDPESSQPYDPTSGLGDDRTNPYSSVSENLAIIKTWDIGLSVDLGHFAHPFIYPSSATQGISVAGVNLLTGKTVTEHRAIYADTQNIFDVKDFSVVLEPGGAGVIANYAGVNQVSHLRSIWAFGGWNLSGYSSNLWHAIPVEDPDFPGTIAYLWTKITPVQDRASGQIGISLYSPSPRAGSALFWSPVSGEILLWGGKNETSALNDFWTFSPSTNTWTERNASGEIPPPLSDFSYTQGFICTPGMDTISSGVVESAGYIPTFDDLCEYAGFIWGGELPDGTLSENLYVLGFKEGDFRKVRLSVTHPPAMKDATLFFDPLTGRLYLYGGFDGTSYHNWLWYLDTQDMIWHLVKEDCLEGTCPYLSRTSALVVSGENRDVIVYPGRNVISDIPKVEPFFKMQGTFGRWIGASEFVSWKVKGDCDGDEVRENLWGSKCSLSELWYHLPGEEVCNTLSEGLICTQEEIPSVRFAEKHVPGLKDFKPRENILFISARGKLIAEDMTNPWSMQKLDEIVVHGSIKDIDLWQDRVIAGIDGGLLVIDASDATNLKRERFISTEGRVLKVKVEGDTAFFLTNSGIGYIDLADPSKNLPDRFACLVRNPDGTWNAVEFGLHCGHSGFGIKDFDVYHGIAYISAGREIVGLDLRSSMFDIIGSLRFDSLIESIRMSQDHVYLNLRNGEKPIIFSSDGSFPEVVGEHNITQWVEGIEESAGKILRKAFNNVEIAILQ